MIRGVPQRLLVVALVVLALAARAGSQDAPRVPPPVQQLGANIGDDYFLATYDQLERYWQTLDAESDRMQLVDIGRTEEGRTQWMAVVSAPENLARAGFYRDIARRLARAEDLSEEEARLLAREGRAIVWIDGGQHANETLGAQQLIELVYQLVAGQDEETRRILRDVIVLAAHANPDGHALVSEWYMRGANPRTRTLDGLPRLYQKYVGHDNNRDFFLASQAETVNINRVLYREWYPQVVYTHHQFAPPGTVMFAPPFAGPFSPHVDPNVAAGVERFGAAMQARFAAEGKRGVISRGGGEYSAWWNGGLRTTAYFHNQIGLLTETIGGPTPFTIPAVASAQQAGADLPFPIAPQVWRFRQSVDYSMSANRAVLDTASRLREGLLLNVYRMGQQAIARGRYTYVLPADQPDFPTAVKFAHALIKAGVVVHRAATTIDAGGRSYPAGTLVVESAQAFGPHVVDMFEPQRHPEGLPDGEPYDVTGWTLALQMGVRFDRIDGTVRGRLDVLADAAPPRSVVTGVSNPTGYVLSHHQNDAAIVVNRLLAAGEEVYWVRDRTVGAMPDGTGVIWAPSSRAAATLLARAASELGVWVQGVATRPVGGLDRLRRPRIALWDRYGGLVSSGWIRWILERYEFPFEVVDARALGAGGLRARYDAIVLPDEAMPMDVAPALHEFANAGGTLLLIGDATSVAETMGVPVRRLSLPSSEFRAPGSVFRMTVDNTSPLAYGFEREVDVMMMDSPLFEIPPEAGVRRVGWFEGPEALRSGWARGQEQLNGRAAVVDAAVGRGRILIYSPEIVFRSQAHATFKFLFNGLYLAGTPAR